LSTTVWTKFAAWFVVGEMTKQHIRNAPSALL
jgi:hypothetical protein